MKKIMIFLLLFGSIPTCLLGVPKEIQREGICGTRQAQAGQYPNCDPSEKTCYVKLYYDDGTTGELDYLAVWEPETSLGYGNVSHVSVWARYEGGIYYNIVLLPNGETFPAQTEQIVIDWINNQ